MAFMEPQVIEKQTWFQVDTRAEGIVSYPAADFSKEQVAAMHEVEPDDVTEIEGYGARMSAPGYLDCTEWTVFDSVEAAEIYLEENYGDDEEDEEDEEDEDENAIRCDQCQALMINGVFCHETGCPNSGKRYEEGEWVKYLECFTCGCDVREGEVCSCQDPIETEE